jgi:hypothetical protein
LILLFSSINDVSGAPELTETTSFRVISDEIFKLPLLDFEFSAKVTSETSSLSFPLLNFKIKLLLRSRTPELESTHEVSETSTSFSFRFSKLRFLNKLTHSLFRTLSTPLEISFIDLVLRIPDKTAEILLESHETETETSPPAKSEPELELESTEITEKFRFSP